MAESFPQPTREEFARLVQEALNRLYDSSYLRTHPLAAIAPAEHDTIQRGQQLRRILLDAIHAMAPSDGVPAQAADWRAFRILELRYVEGMSPTDAMHQLALSRSYFFREQARMLDALTETLWERWQQHAAPAEPAEPPAQAAASTTREELAHAETERLSAQATWEPVSPVDVLKQLQPMIQPLAQSQGVDVQFDLPQHVNVLHADRVLLRQALFTVITYALDVAASGSVRISSFANPGQLGIRVQAQPGRGTEQHLERQGVGLDVCRRLLSAMHGSLEVQEGSRKGWEARLNWPTAVAATMLVVDDNQGFADLFRRYLAGYNWKVLSAGDGAQARLILAEQLPTLIMLDIMMPREDGWEFLVALRGQERTKHIPVIICSVLNEPRLAQSLGADGYLTKPVTQAALLRALAPWNQAGAIPTQAHETAIHGSVASGSDESHSAG